VCVKGAYDLSRRAKVYTLPGMSFREYLNFSTNSQHAQISLTELLKNPQQFNQLFIGIEKIKGHFQNYVQQGYYPFYYEDPLSYYEKILRIIDKTINEDIANFYNLKTVNLGHFKKILNFLTTIPPGSVSVHSISKNLSIDDKTVTNYLHNLEETGLTNLIYPAEGGNLSLRRPEKVFLNNTNLQYALESHLSAKLEIGTIRELLFIQCIKNACFDIFHSKIGDYQVDGTIFEIGGKNKTRKQIKGHDNAFLVKDDIIVASKGEIPLMFFGFLY